MQTEVLMLCFKLRSGLKHPSIFLKFKVPFGMIADKIITHVKLVQSPTDRPVPLSCFLL